MVLSLASGSKLAADYYRLYIPNCTFPELSASCDSAHEALNEPADFWAQTPY